MNPTPLPNPPEDERFQEAELASEMDVAEVHTSILREREDPRDGYEPIPLWLVTLIMAIVFWSGAYLSFNSGGFQSDVFNPRLVSWTGAGAAAQTGPPDPMVLGKKVYTQNCVVCHQQNGQGVAGQFPPLAESEWVLNGDWHGDNHLIKILLLGLQGPVKVKGAVYNGAMPAWNQLKDNQIASVLTYIRNEWGNQGPAITEAQVKEMREVVKGRTDPWTEKDLKAIPRQVYGAPSDGTPPPAEAAASPKPAA